MSRLSEQKPTEDEIWGLIFLFSGLATQQAQAQAIPHVGFWRRLKNWLRRCLPFCLLLLVAGGTQAQTVINSQNFDGSGNTPSSSNTLNSGFPVGWLATSGTNYLNASAFSYNGSGAVYFQNTSGGAAFTTLGYSSQDTNSGNVKYTCYWRYENYGASAAYTDLVFYWQSVAINGETQAGSGYRIQINRGTGSSTNDGMKVERGSSTALNTGASGTAAPINGTFANSFSDGLWYKLVVVSVNGHIQIQMQRPTLKGDGVTANTGGDDKWLTNTGAWSASSSTYAIDVTDGTPQTGAGYFGFGMFSNGTNSPTARFDEFKLEAPTPAGATDATLTGPTSGAVSVASANFTYQPNSTYTGTVTLSASGAGGTFSPTSLSYSSSSAAQTFTFTPAAGASGTLTLTATASGGVVPAKTASYQITRVAGTFYLSAAGNDTTGDGTIGTPWATLSKMFAYGLVPGDTVNLRGGDTFAGGFTYTGTGIANPTTITFQSYATGNAIITAPNATTDALKFVDTGGVNVNHLTFTYTYANTNTNAGIHMRAETNNGVLYQGITISYCTCVGFQSGISVNSSDGASSGFSGAVLSYNIIHDCVLYGMALGGWYGAGTTLPAPASTGFNVHHNNIYNITDSSTHPGCFCILMTRASNSTITKNLLHDATGKGPGGVVTVLVNAVTVSDNEIYNMTVDTSLTGIYTDAIGVDFDWSSTNCIAERNYIHDCYGAGLANFQWPSGSTVASYTGFYNNAGNIYRYNVVSQCGAGAQPNFNSGYGTSVPGQGGFLITGEYITTMYVYNNTFYSNQSGGATFVLGPAGVASGVKAFWNNVCISTGGAPYIYLPANSYTTWTFDGNCYYSNGGAESWRWNGTAYSTFASYKAAAGKEGYSLNTNPLLTSLTAGATIGNADNLSSLTNYTPQAGSPLANGLSLAGSAYLGAGNIGTTNYLGASTTRFNGIGAITTPGGSGSGTTGRKYIH